MTFQNLAYPRRKNFIKNLNILLESPPILSPQKSLASKLFIRNLSEENKNPTNKNQVKSPIKIIEDKRLLSLRKMQEKLKSEQNITRKQSNRNAKSARQFGYSKNNENDGLLNFLSSRATLSPKRNIQTHGSLRSKRFEVQHFNDQYDNNSHLRMAMSTQLQKNNSDLTLSLKHESLQLKKSSEGPLYDYRPREQMKKQYLKKGSRIKTSIMQNIIKMKLIKNGNNFKNGKVDIDDAIQSRHIFGLIKVYKGVDAIQSNQLKAVQRKEDLSKKLKQRKQDPLYIEGWYNDTQQYQQNYQVDNPQPLPEDEALIEQQK